MENVIKNAYYIHSSSLKLNQNLKIKTKATI